MDECERKVADAAQDCSEKKKIQPSASLSPAFGQEHAVPQSGDLIGSSTLGTNGHFAGVMDDRKRKVLDTAQEGSAPKKARADVPASGQESLAPPSGELIDISTLGTDRLRLLQPPNYRLRLLQPPNSASGQESVVPPSGDLIGSSTLGTNGQFTGAMDYHKRKVAYTAQEGSASKNARAENILSSATGQESLAPPSGELIEMSTLGTGELRFLQLPPSPNPAYVTIPGWAMQNMTSEGRSLCHNPWMGDAEYDKGQWIVPPRHLRECFVRIKGTSFMEYLRSHMNGLVARAHRLEERDDASMALHRTTYSMDKSNAGTIRRSVNLLLYPDQASMRQCDCCEDAGDFIFSCCSTVFLHWVLNGATSEGTPCSANQQTVLREGSLWGAGTVERAC